MANKTFKIINNKIYSFEKLYIFCFKIVILVIPPEYYVQGKGHIFLTVTMMSLFLQECKMKAIF